MRLYCRIDCAKAAGRCQPIRDGLTIQACYTTQAIVDNGEIVSNAKKEIEKLVYEVLEL